MFNTVLNSISNCISFSRGYFVTKFNGFFSIKEIKTIARFRRKEAVLRLRHLELMTRVHLQRKCVYKMGQRGVAKKVVFVITS